MKSIARVYGEPVTRAAFWPFNAGEYSGGGTSQPVSQPYRVSTWVQAAIQLVTKPITEVPLVFSKEKRGGTAMKNPALEAYWNEPANGEDGQPIGLSDVIEETVVSLKLCGESFWVFGDTVMMPRDALPYPEEGLTQKRFLIPRADRMRHLIAQDGTLVGWELCTLYGQRIKLAREQVIHVRRRNPYDPYRGLSEYDSCRVAAESDYLASGFKRNLWAQSGATGSFISLENGQMLTPEQQMQLQAQLRERRELAARGIIKDVVFSGMKLESPKTQMVDSAFIDSRPQDWHQVAIAFGVPPSMFEVVASYSVGAASDWYRLIRDTCVPTSRKLSEAVEAAQKLMGEPVFASFDWMTHPVMQQVTVEKMPAARDLFDRGWSWEKINEWLGLGMPQFDGWEERYLPFNVTPAEMVGEDMTQDPAMAEPPDTTPEPMQEMLCEDEGVPMVSKAKDPATKRWNKMMLARRPAWNKYIAAFRKELFKARADVLAKLESMPRSANGTHTKATVWELLFDSHKFATGLKAAFKAPAIFALNAAGNEVRREIGETPDYEMAPRKVTEHLKERENKITGVADEVFDQLRGVMQEGFDAGDSTKEIADNLRERFNDIGKARAKMIAITETAVAYGEARQDSMAESGVPFKQWLTSRGPTVRPSHKAVDRKTVKVDEDFTVGGEPMKGPGDPRASAKQVCNCHCVAVAVMQETGEIEA
jgi:SPP1 gp7 family putative phage head morphogenesis protein